MTRVHWVAPTALLALSLGFGHMPASAQMRRCADRTLDGVDEKRLMSAVRAVWPPNTDLESPGICRNRDAASAWFSSTKITGPDAVVHWWDLRCDRARRGWHCDEPVKKQEAHIDLTVYGRSRPFVVSFDADTTLATATVLTADAVRLVADPETRLAPCLGTKDDLEAWTNARPVIDPASSSPIELEVSTADHDTSIEFPGYFVIHFKQGATDDSPAQTPCWEQRIVVT